MSPKEKCRLDPDGFIVRPSLNPSEIFATSKKIAHRQPERERSGTRCWTSPAFTTDWFPSGNWNCYLVRNRVATVRVEWWILNDGILSTSSGRNQKETLKDGRRELYWWETNRLLRSFGSAVSKYRLVLTINQWKEPIRGNRFAFMSGGGGGLSRV